MIISFIPRARESDNLELGHFAAITLARALIGMFEVSPGGKIGGVDTLIKQSRMSCQKTDKSPANIYSGGSSRESVYCVTKKILLELRDIRLDQKQE